MIIKSKKTVECRSCGSSLLRKNKDGVNCMVCCAGLPEIERVETLGMDYETALSLFGREFGQNGDILARINKPGATFSSIRFDPDDYVHIRKYLSSRIVKGVSRHH